MKIKSKSGLKVFTYQDIISWDACYDLSLCISPSWRGTAVDVLNLTHIPFRDRLLVVLRTDLCSEKLMRLAAVSFYRDTLTWVKDPDPKSLKAANVAERYALGLVKEMDLAEAGSLAELAANSARGSAAWASAWSAYRCTDSSAESAARLAFRLAAKSAAWASSTYVKSGKLGDADPEALAAKLIAQERYKNRMIEMLLAEGRERLDSRRKNEV